MDVCMYVCMYVMYVCRLMMCDSYDIILQKTLTRHDQMGMLVVFLYGRLKSLAIWWPKEHSHWVQYFNVLGKGLHLVNVCGACHSVQALTKLSNANILGSVRKQNANRGRNPRVGGVKDQENGIKECVFRSSLFILPSPSQKRSFRSFRTEHLSLHCSSSTKTPVHPCLFEIRGSWRPFAIFHRSGRFMTASLPHLKACSFAKMPCLLDP